VIHRMCPACVGHVPANVEGSERVCLCLGKRRQSGRMRSSLLDQVNAEASERGRRCLGKWWDPSGAHASENDGGQAVGHIARFVATWDRIAEAELAVEV
jgi:hypothetical protein